MVTINAQLVANETMAEAIENWLDPWNTFQRQVEYYQEELVARGQVLPIAESPITGSNFVGKFYK